MTFRRDWRRLLLHAWSIWLWTMAIIVQVLDVALPWFREALPISDWAFGLLTIAFGVGGILARLMVQRGITQPAAMPPEGER